jgi:hypothetical protein
MKTIALSLLRLWFGIEQDISLAGGRFQSCLREIQKRACDFEDEKKGIRIKKEDWEKLHVHIASYNYFPTAAGLASSAAGLACLGKFSSATMIMYQYRLALTVSCLFYITFDLRCANQEYYLCPLR